MDLEDLNKTQIILLTLLVSFVSAIATSIFTVKILEEAPAAVTQTINRVVERTIERVVPAEPTNGGRVEQTVIEKETTIVVKEEDLITESIEKNKGKIVRFVTIVPGTEPVAVGTSTPEDTTEYVFHGIGVIVSSDGQVVTAPELSDIAELYALIPDGTRHTTSFVRSSGDMAILKIEPNDEEDVINLSPVTFVDTKTLRLGQTVIALGGEDRTSVSLGIIASLLDGEIVSGEAIKNGLVSVQTNIGGSIPGSPIVNIFGEIVGINLEGVPGVFTSSAVIKAELEPLTALEEESTETTQIEADTTQSK